MTIEELAWAAGIVDGEGTITLARGARSRGPRDYYPLICVTNTNEAMLLRMQQIIGGLIRPHTRTNPLIVSRKPVWQLRIAGDKRCRPVLESLLPYLIAKKDNARILLEFRKNPYHTLSVIELIQREHIRSRLRVLNGKTA